MDRTLVICKPDAVERGLVGEIVSRLERKGLRLAAAELRTIDADTAGRHYEEHQGKSFFASLVEFITRSPSMLMVVEGPQDTWKVVRT
ncbi:MAG: nucleoside-diphosphate kinase, partial [Acidimicrobiaceae bacterium]|nr:nucleoside-diphosphate kinase [Acidimicrobiaceae bacterium]